MADFTNTDSPREPQPTTFPSPLPGDQQRLNWPDYLLAMATVVDHMAPGGEPVMFISNYLIGLSRQARLMGATTPGDHLEKAEAAADREAAYVAGLEQAAEAGGTWALGPDPDLGSWGGHPDEATRQAHIAIDPESETWRN
jgi:hypothetical protein